jgi:hypothetical protein
VGFETFEGLPEDRRVTDKKCIGIYIYCSFDCVGEQFVNEKF